MDKWDKQEKENTNRKRRMKRMATKKMKEINHMIKRDTTLTEMNKDGSPKITWNEMKEYYLLHQSDQMSTLEFFKILEKYFYELNEPSGDDLL